MQYLDMPKVASILEKAQGNPRDHLLLLLSAMHGLRASEAAALTLSDVADFKIHATRVKGSVDTYHPLLTNSNPLFDEKKTLTTWLEKHPKNTEALFPSRKGGFMRADTVGKLAKRYMVLAGVPPRLAHHHSLKHFCCAHMCRAGVGIEFIKQFVGHAAISSTVLYLGISDDEAAAKAQAVFSA